MGELDTERGHYEYRPAYYDTNTGKYMLYNGNGEVTPTFTDAATATKWLRDRRYYRDDVQVAVLRRWCGAYEADTPEYSATQAAATAHWNPNRGLYK